MDADDTAHRLEVMWSQALERVEAQLDSNFAVGRSDLIAIIADLTCEWGRTLALSVRDPATAQREVEAAVAHYSGKNSVPWNLLIAPREVAAAAFFETMPDHLKFRLPNGLTEDELLAFIMRPRTGRQVLTLLILGNSYAVREHVVP